MMGFRARTADVEVESKTAHPSRSRHPTRPGHQRWEPTAPPRADRPQPRPAVAHLQRTHGNRAIQRMAATRRRGGPSIRVAPSSDPAEREATRVAASVLQSGPPSGARSRGDGGAGTSRASRLCPQCQRRLKTGQPLNCPDCEATLHRSASDTRASVEGVASPGVAAPGRDHLGGILAGGRGRPLPGPLRADFESRFQRRFDAVRLHTDRRAAISAEALHAEAYTVGPHVVFSSSAYAPHTASGRQLLAHELAHAVQQGAAPVVGGDAGAEVTAPGITQRRPDSTPRAATAPVRVTEAVIRPTVQRQEEAVTQAWRVGPFDALQAKSDADKALRDAGATGLPGLHNGPGDAWRHCYWNCLMTRSIGAGQARTVADTHEEFGGNQTNEIRMDTHNNAVGRSCGTSRGGCWECCMDALNNGRLRIIPDWAGRATGSPVPSSPVPGARSRPPSGGGGGSGGGYY